MHEFSLAVSVVEEAADILKKMGGKKVLALTLDIGILSGVSPEALQFCFPEVILGTCLERCRLHINQIPLLVYCPQCQREEQVEGPFPLCPRCQEVKIEVRKGKEFNITNMEIE
ncbi:MAG: hydrogenase maturation nickel metallochaperone HypA [Bdellovibrio sp.]|nr:hydrogenase maturation nickel metallochaperone HypA [Bdellovibrio sp.]